MADRIRRIPRVTRVSRCSAARFWTQAGWDILTTTPDGSQMLTGEAKWFARTPEEKMVRSCAVELLRKGIPPVNGPVPKTEKSKCLIR